MGFYEEISTYYDIIFPTGEEQVAFLRGSLKGQNQRVLDVACGTGGYSLALAGLGHQVTGIDLDEEMIRRAKDKGGDFQQMDMLKIDKSFGSDFDLVFCIGNSLVHLPGKVSVDEFLQATSKVLKPGGAVAIQIINFDRVLDKGVTKLPTLTDENTGLVFERNYLLKDLTILFNTVLTVDGKRFENSIPLFPLRSNELLDMLEAAGFKDIEVFGDFAGGAFEKSESFVLVVRARVSY